MIRKQTVQVTEEALLKMLPSRLHAEAIVAVSHDATRGMLTMVFAATDEGWHPQRLYPPVEGAHTYVHPTVTQGEIETLERGDVA